MKKLGHGVELFVLMEVARSTLRESDDEFALRYAFIVYYPFNGLQNTESSAE